MSCAFRLEPAISPIRLVSKANKQNGVETILSHRRLRQQRERSDKKG
jgi:hypothetical protein